MQQTRLKSAAMQESRAHPWNIAIPPPVRVPQYPEVSHCMGEYWQASMQCERVWAWNTGYGDYKRCLGRRIENGWNKPTLVVPTP